MLRKIGLAFTVTGLMLATPVLAKDEVRLKPVTPWHVDWTKNSCTLARGFGKVKDPQVVMIEQFTQSQNFQLLLIADSMRGIKQSDMPTISFTVGDTGIGFGEKLPRAIVGINAKRTPTLFIPNTHLLGDLPGNTRALEAEITQVRVKARRGTIIFETGPLNKPFDAMRACTDNLVKSWGLDPEKMRSLSREPTPKSNTDDWLRSSDYPTASLIAGSQALITYRLLIDNSGMPTNCLIQRSYSDEAVDRVTCKKLMQRARFDPALDENGKPVPSYWVQTSVWYITH